MLFDWSVQPFYTLILTFLFAPYFANVVVGNGPEGQSMWGYAAAVAGVLIAVGSPFLGAFADGRGQRKPWIALFSVILAVAMASLWIATPAAPSSTIYLVLLAFVFATACAEYTAVFTNAIMPSLVPQKELGRLSGAGWACGYFGGLASLFLVAGLIVPAGRYGHDAARPRAAVRTRHGNARGRPHRRAAVGGLVPRVHDPVLPVRARSSGKSTAHDGSSGDGGAVGHGALAAGQSRTCSASSPRA